MIVKNGIPITLNLSTTLDAVFNFILSCVIGLVFILNFLGREEKNNY